MNWKKNIRVFSLTVGMILFLQACLSLTVDSSTQEPAQATITRPAITRTPTPAGTSTRTPTPLVSPTPTPTTLAKVTIKAVGGNINIRRGPDAGFNLLGALKKGESAKILGKEILEDWVQIQIPNSEAIGWVSTQTGFSEIVGRLDLIPVLDVVEFPKPAYIANCTPNLLYILPGKIYLPPVMQYPNNEITVNPGYYYVFDLADPAESQILEFGVGEGQWMDIEKDFLGDKYGCP